MVKEIERILHEFEARVGCVIITEVVWYKDGSSETMSIEVPKEDLRYGLKQLGWETTWTA